MKLRAAARPRRAGGKGFPAVSAAVLAAVAAGCLLSGVIAPGDPAHIDLGNFGAAPCAQFPFGTDTLGRDVYSMVWHGGLISLFIGFAAAAVSTLTALVIGTLCGLASARTESVIMRGIEIIMSVPGLLLALFVQAALGEAGALSLALVIGLTGWMGMAKVVCAEVKRLSSCGYVIAAKGMGAGVFHILRRHLAPNVLSSVMFMSIMSARGAMMAEATLSFMGLGLPLDVISWGSMLSLAENGMLSGAWWVIVVPGAFLAVTLLCVTNIGEYIRRSCGKKPSNLKPKWN